MTLMRHTALALAGILTMLANAVQLYADVVTDAAQRRYHVNADGATLELTYLACDSSNVSLYRDSLTVPAQTTANGQSYQVTGVTPLACVYCDGLRSVTIEEGVQRIGFGAFSDCPRLSDVQLPASLTELQDWSFYHDTALTVMTLPDDVSRVGSCAFAFCSGLDSIGLSAHARVIASHALYHCNALQLLTIPGYVDQIGEYAFAYCSGLRTIRVEGAPVAITPDVFEGVEADSCRLIVPYDMEDAYRNADVWCDFIIETDAVAGIDEVRADDEWPSGFGIEVRGTTLWLYVNGDAPALVYDIQGRRIAVAASHSGVNQVQLTHGVSYIVRCGKKSMTFTL